MTGVSYTLLLGMTPAPPEILGAVQNITVESSLEDASAFRLRLGIAQTPIGDWTVLQEDLFRPLLPIQVRIQVGTSAPKAVINGYVSGQQVSFSDHPAQSALEVSGMDATLLMNLQEKVTPWPGMPDSAIAAALYGQYGVVPQIQPTPPSLIEPEGTTTQRGTDIRFLRRLALRNGFECYVQPEPLTGLDFGYFRPPSLTGLPQAVLSVNMGPETNVSEFRVQYEMLRPTTAIAMGLDVPTKAPQPALAPAALQVPLGLEGSLMRILPPPIVRPADTGLPRSSDLQALAQSIVDRSTWAISVEGKLDTEVGLLFPGGLVNIRGVGRVYNGSYYVTRVTHSIGPDGYTQRFQARRNAVGMTGAELFVEL